MSFRRLVFEQIGGFKEGLGRNGDDAAGCEETEFCIRARNAFPGSTILYDPAVVAYHNVAEDRLSWRYFRTRCQAEGRSKTLVAREVGAPRALSTEIQYITRVLPAGVLRGLADTLFRGDPWGVARSAAIFLGFFFTVASYVRAKLRRSASRGRPRDFSPIRILDLDRAKPLPRVEARTPEGTKYGGVFCLIREKGRPLGIAELELKGKDLSPSRLESLIRCDKGLKASEPSSRRIESGSLPSVTVVVATRDRSTSLATCIDSLLQQEYDSFDIIVVDSAPASSETADLIAKRYVATGRVRYLRDDQPGLGRAHNSGFAEVKAPIVAFTDDDVIVDPRWLAAIASAFDAGENVGCVTGLILPAELETRAQVWTERHGGFGKGFERKIFDLRKHRPLSRLFPYTAGQLGSGANMAFRTDALRRMGGFDSALGAGTLARGGDDLAAFYSVINSGYQLVYEPEAIVWHHHRRSEEGMRRQAFGYGVGLGAYLTKLVLDQPSTLFRLAAALPAGLRHMVGASSPKNKRLPDDYPTNLIWRERLGIIAGAPAYVRSRLAVHRGAATTFQPASRPRSLWS